MAAKGVFVTLETGEITRAQCDLRRRGSVEWQHLFVPAPGVAEKLREEAKVLEAEADEITAARAKERKAGKTC